MRKSIGTPHQINESIGVEKHPAQILDLNLIPVGWVGVETASQAFKHNISA